MPRAATIPDALRGRIFRASDVVARGLPTRAQLRSSAWRQVRRDIYVDANVPAGYGLSVAAAALILPPGGLIAGRSAAWLHGVQQASASDPVEALIPSKRAGWAPAGITVHAERVRVTDAIMRGRRRLTTCARTCVDIARWHETIVAVPIIDAMLAARLVTAVDLQKQLGSAPSEDLGRVQGTLALCDRRAESPPESVLRVRLILAGLPAPVPQHEVWRGNQFVARVDLGWPDQRVAVEYDGAYHAAPGQLGKDRRRLNALTAAGWTVIHVTAADMYALTPVINQLRVLLLQSA